MKRIFTVLVLTVIIFSCKQKTKVAPQEQVVKEVEQTYQLPSTIKEVATFANISLTDTTDLDTIMQFKSMDETGLNPISMEQAVLLYKEAINTPQTKVLPIFEIKNPTNSVLILSGKGHSGSIWAKLLVNRTTLEIKKVEFGHKSESEGYGAAITLSSFEDQFVGAKIDALQNTYGLNQSGRKMIEGTVAADGLSGATITSQAVVQMCNEGLLNYKNYLNH